MEIVNANKSVMKYVNQFIKLKRIELLELEIAPNFKGRSQKIRSVIGDIESGYTALEVLRFVKRFEDI